MDTQYELYYMAVDCNGNLFRNIVDTILVDSTMSMSELKELIKKAYGEELKDFPAKDLRLYVYTSVDKMSTLDGKKGMVCIERETKVNTITELSNLIDFPNLSNII